MMENYYKKKDWKNKKLKKNNKKIKNFNNYYFLEAFTSWGRDLLFLVDSLSFEELSWETNGRLEKLILCFFLTAKRAWEA